MARWIGAPWPRRWRDPVRRLWLLGRVAVSHPAHAPGGVGASPAPGLDPDRDARHAHCPVFRPASYWPEHGDPRDLARGRFRGLRISAGGCLPVASSADRYAAIGLGGRRAGPAAISRVATAGPTRADASGRLPGHLVPDLQ